MIDGLLVDAGVSSPQLDRPERGFSLLQDGPLDMRMSEAGESCAELIDRLDVRALARILARFGEVDQAGRLARAIKQARARGIRVGMFRPITLWPFPVAAFESIVDGKSGILVAEMNAGQLITEVERYRPRGCRIEGLNRIDGETITPRQILHRLQELADRE